MFIPLYFVNDYNELIVSFILSILYLHLKWNVHEISYFMIELVIAAKNKFLPLTASHVNEKINPLCHEGSQTVTALPVTATKY